MNNGTISHLLSLQNYVGPASLHLLLPYLQFHTCLLLPHFLLSLLPLAAPHLVPSAPAPAPASASLQLLLVDSLFQLFVFGHIESVLISVQIVVAQWQGGGGGLRGEGKLQAGPKRGGCCAERNVCRRNLNMAAVYKSIRFVSAFYFLHIFYTACGHASVSLCVSASVCVSVRVCALSRRFGHVIIMALQWGVSRVERR